jgi:hypothetical protein
MPETYDFSWDEIEEMLEAPVVAQSEWETWLGPYDVLPAASDAFHKVHVETIPFGRGSRAGVAVTADVKIDRSAVENMLAGLSGDVTKMLQWFGGRATIAVRQTSDKRITHRTHRYRKSIKAEFGMARATPPGVNPWTLSVVADVPYAAILEKGSRRHMIYPKKPLVIDPITGKRSGGVLRFDVGVAGMKRDFLGRFTGGKRIIYTRYVNHPGTRPYHILRDGIRDAAINLANYRAAEENIRGTRISAATLWWPTGWQAPSYATMYQRYTGLIYRGPDWRNTPPLPRP